MQLPYVDNLGVNILSMVLTDGTLTLLPTSLQYTQGGRLTVGLGMRLITWLMRG